MSSGQSLVCPVLPEVVRLTCQLKESVWSVVVKVTRLFTESGVCSMVWQGQGKTSYWQSLLCPILPVGVREVLAAIILPLVTLCCLRHVIATVDQSPASQEKLNWAAGDPRWCLERLWEGEDPDKRTQMFEASLSP
ncbi:hypothetical protein RRG08_015559 [Elysia crispata]|uniref:Uncharacterized protein n=1 Tax=Elysia crispata TaxID=231223 RepID=A0AAE1CZN3_9GAST|nr:hypothetical protein RRG08_015559 [Elysia crispata]